MIRVHSRAPLQMLLQRAIFVSPGLVNQGSLCLCFDTNESDSVSLVLVQTDRTSVCLS
jgi:hypothetical protein